MLSIKKRQEYLKYLGFYNDKIDGIVGVNTKNAYKKLQNKYFSRKSDKDGIYGINTERLLINAYNVKKYCKNFKLEEFKCECNGRYCTGYPTQLSTNLLKYIQGLRNKYGPITITSGIRCDKLNSAVGGIRGSKHTKGKALDFYNARECQTLSRRKAVINYYIKNAFANYSYCNGYARTKLSTSYPKSATMGSAIHIDVI